MRMLTLQTQTAFENYFTFNNLRTLTSSEPCQLEIHRFENITAYVDPTRQFDNQVIIHNACTNEEAVEALVLYQNSFYPEVRIAPSAQSLKLGSFLSNSDFHYMYDIEFMQLSAEQYLSAAPQTSIQIERWESNRVDEFRALLKTSGVQCSDEIWQAKREFYCSEQFRCFVAIIDNQPVAWATSFLDNSFAILANAYTQEAARNKGCHSALLHARINDAIALGANTLLTDVMPESVSAKNCAKAGFTVSQMDMVWVK